MTDRQPPLIRIVDDEADVREALALMLEIEGFRCVVYESARDFLLRDDRVTPGCLLLDVRMPELSGFALQDRLLAREIELPVIFVTGYADLQVAVDSLKKGALDFLLKPVDAEKLLEAVARALTVDRLRRGGVASPEALKAGVKKLSEREREILQLILKGLKDKAVAERLGLSERTVQGHRANIYGKLGLHSAKQLELIADELERHLGFVPMPRPADY